uniref:Uncharacterized protein n=1 Tax=Rhizophora mucronata TaxID=61149 RepID=A0A2P2IV51_RHIMU
MRVQKRSLARRFQRSRSCHKSRLSFRLQFCWSFK